MTRLLLRVALTALALMFLLPMIDGIQFHGNFLQAVGVAAVFAVASWAVSRVAAWLTAVLAVGTLGLGLLILIPMWIFGFWLLPVAALKLVADIMPAYLAVAGWGPAIWGGLVLMVVNILTATKVSAKTSSNG